MLLCFAGDRGLELYNSWNLSVDKQKKLVNYWTNFETYVTPQANKIMARYKLHCLQQQEQSIDIWIMAASELATECGYGEIRDEMLRDHIVFVTNSEAVRTKCLEIGDKITLQQARQFALTHEHTQRQLKQMSGQMSGTKDIHSVKKRPQSKNKFKKSGKITTTSPATTTKHGHSNNKCFNCGGNRHPMRECPAREAKCYNCSRIGHFSKLCLSKNKNVNTVDTSYDHDFVMTVIVCHTPNHM